MIQKHAIPILSLMIILRQSLYRIRGLDLQLPKKCTYAFWEEEIDRYAQEIGADCVGSVSATRPTQFMSWTTKSEKVCHSPKRPLVLLQRPSLWIG